LTLHHRTVLGMVPLTAAVVVCAYTLERWDDLVASINSAASQSPAPDELWLVVDHNPELLERAQRELGSQHRSLRVVANGRKQGLSGARNTALIQVSSDVVVFLDDDASAEAGWLRDLLAPYADASVVAVGGAASPKWPTGWRRPVTLPSSGGTERGELDWVVGCTYRGQPVEQRPVRNLMGCNMSFQRKMFADVGGFSEDLGRVGKTPLGCEETELCIRVTRAHPQTQIIFEPSAVVRHHVSLDRLSWKYLRRRCYAEGVSKAAVSAMVGPAHALNTERSYAAKILPSGVVRELAAAVRPGEHERSERLGGALAIVVAFTATSIGYLRGRLSRVRPASPLAGQLASD